MNRETEKKLVSVLRSDPDFTPEMITKFIAAGVEFAGRCSTSFIGERILSRRQVAAKMGVCQASVDNFAKRGWIQRVYLPGAKKARGFSESSVANCMSARRFDIPSV